MAADYQLTSETEVSAHEIYAYIFQNNDMGSAQKIPMHSNPICIIHPKRSTYYWIPSHIKSQSPEMCWDWPIAKCRHLVTITGTAYLVRYHLLELLQFLLYRVWINRDPQYTV